MVEAGAWKQEWKELEGESMAMTQVELGSMSVPETAAAGTNTLGKHLAKYSMAEQRAIQPTAPPGFSEGAHATAAEVEKPIRDSLTDPSSLLPL